MKEEAGAELWLYFSFRKMCFKFCHMALVKQFLCGRRLYRNAYRITSRRKGDGLHMVICYDLYGSERISVSQMGFLQFAILISVFCLYAAENPKSRSKLPAGTSKSSMIK